MATISVERIMGLPDITISVHPITIVMTPIGIIFIIARTVGTIMIRSQRYIFRPQYIETCRILGRPCAFNQASEVKQTDDG